MSVVGLRRAWCSLRVTFRVVVYYSLVNRTLLLFVCIPKPYSSGKILCFLLVVVGSSRLVLAVPRVVPLFATVLAGRCLCCHVDATTGDRPLGSVVT